MANRYLRGNKGEWGPSTILFGDSETVPVTEVNEPKRTYHVLQCWHASGGRYRENALTCPVEASGVDSDAFWAWVATQLTPREVTWLVFHHWSFDCESLGWRSVLDKGEYVLERGESTDCEDGQRPGRKSAFTGLWVDEGPPAICSVMHRDGGRLVIVDSMNWLPESLASLGKTLRMDKVPLPDPTDPLWKHQRRCAQDVKILQRVMLMVLKSIKQHKMGNLRYTAAGQAMALFRHRLMPEKILIHDNYDARRLERAGYYGGRIELYYKGKVIEDEIIDYATGSDDPPAFLPPPHGPIYELDASGLYPAVMAEEWFPTRLVDYWDVQEHGPRDVANLGGHCIADVSLESPFWAWPQRAESGVVWCTGNFRTVLAGPELREALRLGVVKGCWRYAKYSLARHLRDFALECWTQRLKAETASPPNLLMAKWWKYVVNALHGKFAQRTPKWISTGRLHDEIRWGRCDGERGASIGFPGTNGIPDYAQWNEERQEFRWWSKERVIAGVIQRAEEQDDADGTFPAIAAYVASAARERVRAWMEMAGRFNVLACHTDSIHVTQAGYDALRAAGQIRERELGYLRLVHQSDTAEFLACGFFKLGEKECHSGIGMRYTQMDDGSYEWLQFEPLSAAVGHDPGPGVLIRQMRRSAPQQYLKGIVDASGWIAQHPRMEPQAPGACPVRSCER